MNIDLTKVDKSNVKDHLAQAADGITPEAGRNLQSLAGDITSVVQGMHHHDQDKGIAR